MTIKDPKVTPLQWAVLLHYTYVLPQGAFRNRVRHLVHRFRPDWQGAALVLASTHGFIARGRITPKGRKAAQELLQQLGVA